MGRAGDDRQLCIRQSSEIAVDTPAEQSETTGEAIAFTAWVSEVVEGWENPGDVEQASPGQGL